MDEFNIWPWFAVMVVLLIALNVWDIFFRPERTPDEQEEDELNRQAW